MHLIFHEICFPEQLADGRHERHERQGAVRRWLHPHICSLYIEFVAKIGAFIKKCTIGLNIIGKPPHYYWVNELRYLGIFIVRSRNFKCSLTNAKKSFYRSANAIFGKICRIAAEEATVELISSKCISVLIYGLEVGMMKPVDWYSRPPAECSGINSAAANEVPHSPTARRPLIII